MMEQPRILSILQAILWAVVLSILVRETQGMQYLLYFTMYGPILCFHYGYKYTTNNQNIKNDKMHSPNQGLPYGQDLYDTRRVLTNSLNNVMFIIYNTYYTIWIIVGPKVVVST